MEITEIGRCKLSFDATQFSIECPLGTAKFSGLATSRLPKLYVASVDDKPIYVGITKQSIRNRLRLGWTAKGDSATTVTLGDTSSRRRTSIFGATPIRRLRKTA